MRAEISKLRTEVTQLKESGDEIKSSVVALNSRMTAAEDRIRELEDELHKAYRQQQIMAKDLKMAIEQIRVLGDDFKRNNIRIIGLPIAQVSNPNEKNTVKDIIAKKFPELEKTGI